MKYLHSISTCHIFFTNNWWISSIKNHKYQQKKEIRNIELNIAYIFVQKCIKYKITIKYWKKKSMLNLSSNIQTCSNILQYHDHQQSSNHQNSSVSNLFWCFEMSARITITNRNKKKKYTEIQFHPTQNTRATVLTKFYSCIYNTCTIGKRKTI